MSATLELRRQRQEERKFKVSICDITSSILDWVTYITPSLKQTNKHTQQQKTGVFCGDPLGSCILPVWEHSSGQVHLRFTQSHSEGATSQRIGTFSMQGHLQRPNWRRCERNVTLTLEQKTSGEGSWICLLSDSHLVCTRSLSVL